MSPVKLPRNLIEIDDQENKKLFQIKRKTKEQLSPPISLPINKK
jgi:hypothetical protein